MPYIVKSLDPKDRVAVERCFPVFEFLRPHLGLAEFARRVEVQTREGYEIAFVEDDGDVAAAAGYRIVNSLAWGRVLYIDDLATHPSKQRRGLGGALMDWLVARARERDCAEVHLDTGYQRHDAHRLYLGRGMRFVCHHAAITL